MQRTCSGSVGRSGCAAGWVIAEPELAGWSSVVVCGVGDDAAESSGFRVDVLEYDAVTALGDGAALPCVASSDDGVLLEAAFCGIFALGTAGEVEVGPLHVTLTGRVPMRVRCLDAFPIPFCDASVSREVV